MGSRSQRLMVARAMPRIVSPAARARPRQPPRSAHHAPSLRPTPEQRAPRHLEHTGGFLSGELVVLHQLPSLLDHRGIPVRRRPRRTPRSLAASSPALARSRIRLYSNCATAARTCRISLPVEPWGREAIFNGPEMDAALVEVGEHLGGEGKAPASRRGCRRAGELPRARD
jgi:hypothetical protein